MNGKIHTNELLHPGYVWFSCEHYGLEDTEGHGYCCTYRPMAGDMYKGNHVVTPEMVADCRDHYAKEDAEKAETPTATVVKRASRPEICADMTKLAAAMAEQRYDLIHNEGASGYNPYRFGSEPAGETE